MGNIPSENISTHCGKGNGQYEFKSNWWKNYLTTFQLLFYNFWAREVSWTVGETFR